MRRYIDILNEFASSDDEGGNKTILIFDIIWDTDEPNLPTQVTVREDDLDDVMFGGEHEEDDLFGRIGDWLSEKFSGALSNFDYRVL